MPGWYAQLLGIIGANTINPTVGHTIVTTGIESYALPLGTSVFINVLVRVEKTPCGQGT